MEVNPDVIVFQEILKHIWKINLLKQITNYRKLYHENFKHIH